MGSKDYLNSLELLNNYAATLAKNSLSDINDGQYCFEDVLDDGQGNNDIVIRVKVSFTAGQIALDFTGSAKQVAGNINCPLSVTAAEVYSFFRCLMPSQTPECAGSFRHISILAPEGTVVTASFPVSAEAGEVETSTAIVYLVIGALAAASPEKY